MIVMESLGTAFRRRRLAMGLTRSAVSRVARVSPAAVRDIGAGRGHPAPPTLRHVLRQVGMTVQGRSHPADWDLLAALGLPLNPLRVRHPRRSEDALCSHLERALEEVLTRSEAVQDDRERKIEALQALLLAIRLHYPSLYRRRLARSPRVRSLSTDDPSGRVVKLVRIALAALAEYL